MQTAALVFTALAPLLLWAAVRRWPTDRLRTIIRRTLAVALLVFEIGELGEKMWLGEGLANALPMHLCDWVLLAVAAALWWQWQLGFELGYFWGLAGTIQALLTPALDPNSAWWRQFAFFFAHALIVVSVLHLVITERCRPWPRSFLRLFIASEIYVASALAVNALVGANYGFLGHPPAQASLLDHLSKMPWLYILEINALAFIFFPLLYLPWLAWDFMAKRSPAASPIPPA